MTTSAQLKRAGEKQRILSDAHEEKVHQADAMTKLQMETNDKSRTLAGAKAAIEIEIEKGGEVEVVIVTVLESEVKNDVVTN